MPTDQPTIDRISANDVFSLVTDHGPVPINIAAILMFSPGASPTFADIHEVLAQRVPSIRRLRQRLVHPPFGAGRPIWVDDESFDLDHHLSHSAAPVSEPHDHVLSLTASLVCSPLAPDRPLWRAHLVTGSHERAGALILVVHHVLADGLGGLAVLAALSDGWPLEPPEQPFPEPAPSRTALTKEALRARGAALKRLPASLARGIRGLRELGIGQGTPRLAARTSLNQPSGSTKRLTTVTASLPEVVAAAHEHGGTVNDAVVAVIIGGFSELLGTRGEDPGHLVVSMPISMRRTADTGDLGNQVGALPVSVPTSEDFDRRFRAVRDQRQAAAGSQRGSSAGPLGALFAGLGFFGLVQFFIDHQRLVNTFITNVRGPQTPLAIAGHRVSRVVPVAINPGNVSVSFDVLSYAGELIVTVVADPELVTDQTELTALIDEELTRLTAA